MSSTVFIALLFNGFYSVIISDTKPTTVQVEIIDAEYPDTVIHIPKYSKEYEVTVHHKDNFEKNGEIAMSKAKQYEYDTPYRLSKSFDVWLCDYGRLQVSKGAEFEVHFSGLTEEVYFLNSKNTLPLRATTTFLSLADYKKFDTEIKHDDKVER